MASGRMAADLCVKPGTRDAAEGIVRRAAELGYGVLGVEAGGEIWEATKETCRELGIRCLRRVTLASSSTSRIKKMLRNSRHADLVAVKPGSVSVARFAARDGRVKLVVAYTPTFLDRSERRLFNLGGGAVEIPLPRPGAVQELRLALISMRRAVASGLRVVLSSHAQDEWGLWPPASAASLAVLAGLPARLGFEFLYTNYRGVV